MLWSFIAVCFSAWLYVDASYRGPAWRRWVFKPVTLILLLLLAWQAPMFNAISYLVLAGLCASLLGDALTLLPRQPSKRRREVIMSKVWSLFLWLG
ncbi:lysoplasmalogenase family protein, partial [Klebsiella pneumoniae]|uniref:lysoplasmalogenase family protein n=1 Tax=Klebsiella pneumoniae TaxID=573 RepID=UPI003968BC19